MQILEQTHKNLEQLGTKVCLQKKENELLLAKKKIQNPDEEMQNQDGDEFEEGQIDAYGNKIENQEDMDERI